MWSPPSKTKKLPTEALRVKANIDEDPSLSQHCRRTQNRGVCNEATETNSGLDEHREHRKDEGTQHFRQVERKTKQHRGPVVAVLL